MSDKDPAERQVPAAPGPTGEATPEDRDHLRRLQKERRSRVIKTVAILVILVLLIVFVLKNSDRVPVDFVFFTRHARLIWVLVVTAILGGIAGYLIGRPSKKVRLHDQAKKDPKTKR